MPRCPTCAVRPPTIRSISSCSRCSSAGWDPEERDEAIALLRGMVERHPAHAWAQRELAFKLGLNGEHEAAWACASAALAVAPQQAHTHSTLGFVRLREGRLDEARRHLRDAIALSVDNDYAIGTLIDLEPTLEQRRAALQFVRDELERQVTLGDALLTYQENAQAVLDTAELQAVLEQMLAAREDLWQAWAAVAIQRMRNGQLAEAAGLLAEAIERFPLVPRLHVELARAATLRGDREARASACARRCRSRRPGSVRCACSSRR